jgi:carboxypeptidase PM20D1
MNTIKKALLLPGAAIVLLVLFTLARTVRYETALSPIEPAVETAIPQGAAERLAGSLRFRTISHDDPAAFDAKAFRDLHAYLVDVFPQAHSRLQREIVGRHSLLYTWQGSDPSLKPVLLSGHLDVVPIEPETEQKWKEDPFGGKVAEAFIWGRGAIDNKSTVMGTLEAVEILVSEGFWPTRTVYLAFGHDEEVGGAKGAHEIAALLKRRGVQLEMVLDEGGVIGDGILSGISTPAALVGVAEKGFVSIELRTRSAGGHSSLPTRETAIGILSAAIARLEKTPMAARLEGPTRQFFDRIGPLFSFPQRAVFANLWLTRPLVLRNLEGNPVTNAMVRTTAAPTIFQAGTKDNVLPSDARGVINYRILPGDSIAGIVEHVRRSVDDSRVAVKVVGNFSAEPSAVSTTDSNAFRTLERTIRKIAPDTIVVPYLVVVVTDARYYTHLSSNIFRFLPIRMRTEDLERMHGIDERLGVQQYQTVIQFYRQLILDATGS